MEQPKINVLNLTHRTDRRDHIINEFKTQQILDYQFWTPIYHETPFISIAKSHKMIVEYAKREGLSHIIVAEDDVKFPDTGAFQYYIDNMPKEFSLYLSCAYWTDEKEGKVNDFSSLILYTIHSSYYDTFINTPENGHLDRSQAVRNPPENIPIPRGNFILCNLFCAYQLEGISDNGDRKVSNEQYLNKRKFFSSTKPYFTWDEIHARSVAANNALIATSS